MGSGGPRRAGPRNLYSLLVTEKGAYLAAEPTDDARFVAVFAHSLEHTGGYTPEEATRVARTLLPDILFYDPTRPASYPDNGRTLSDDAMDVFLSILTNGKVTRDNVGPHKDLLASFPYVGSPHKARSAELAPRGRAATEARCRGVETSLERIAECAVGFCPQVVPDAGGARRRRNRSSPLKAWKRKLRSLKRPGSTSAISTA